MKLYHGTTLAVAETALRDGLKPRAVTKLSSRWKDAPSNPRGVYLTDAYPLYFALHSADDNGFPAVVEIDTDLLQTTEPLVPDEDALEQTLRQSDGLDRKWSLHKRTAYYRDRLAQHRGTSTWQASLRALGTCAHLGTIPAAAITRVAHITDYDVQARLCWMAADAMIMIANYQFCAMKYRAITAHLFGDTPEPDPLFNTHAELATMPRTGIIVVERT